MVFWEVIGLCWRNESLWVTIKVIGLDANEVQEFSSKTLKLPRFINVRISLKIFDNIRQCPSPRQQQEEEKLISRCSGSDSTENCDNQWKSSWTTVFLSFPQFIWLLWCSQISTLAALAEMRIFFTSFHGKASNLLMSIARYIIKIGDAGASEKDRFPAIRVFHVDFNYISRLDGKPFVVFCVRFHISPTSSWDGAKR